MRSCGIWKSPARLQRHVSVEIKDSHPEVECRSIAGFRDAAIHAYPTIDEEVVWDIVQRKVPTCYDKSSGFWRPSFPATSSLEYWPVLSSTGGD